MFDLDGTITRRDTLVPYLIGFLRRSRQPLWAVRWAVRVLGLVPVFIWFLLGQIDRGRLKSAFIQSALLNRTRSEIEAWNAEFVPWLLGNGVFADALEQIERHRRDGARLVLLSASTDLYVPAIGRALGFAEAICTGLTWNGDRLTGDLATPNRRGVEKARCFESLRRRYPGVSAAYGNARSDLDHLRLADRPLLVNASRSARRAATQLAVPTADWR